MSDQQARPVLVTCGQGHEPCTRGCFEPMPARLVTGPSSGSTPGEGRAGLPIEHFLPNQHRRMIGPWCFVDRFGPVDLAENEGMRVGPHPHLGVQTITWLFEGEIEHRDSLGNQQLIEPGQLNVVTAGKGLSHSEETPARAPHRLHGVQVWVALPEEHREIEPRFQHLDTVPTLILPGMRVQVLLGKHSGVGSPATSYSNLIGAVVNVAPGAGGDAVAWLPLLNRHEYVILPIDGDLLLDDEAVTTDNMYCLAAGRTGVEIRSDAGCRFLLLGGEPFAEEALVWWNFVARSHDEIVSARARWNAHAPQFGTVRGCSGERVTAPAMPKATLRPRPR